jgi:hypothetical protein
MVLEGHMQRSTQNMKGKKLWKLTVELKRKHVVLRQRGSRELRRSTEKERD